MTGSTGGFDLRVHTNLEFDWGQGRARAAFEGPTGGFMGEGLFQPLHILLIIGIALLLFGPSKFADLGKGLGEGIRNFKSAIKEPEEKAKRNAQAASRISSVVARTLLSAHRLELQQTYEWQLPPAACSTPALPAVPPHCCNPLRCEESSGTRCLGSRRLPLCP